MSKKEEVIRKPGKRRKIAVTVVTLLVALVSYIIFRGSYLEVKAIGEEYLAAFWRKELYTVLIFAINFIILYCVFYFTNRKVKSAMKIIFEDEKKPEVKIPNKSISFIIGLIGSIVFTLISRNQILLAFSNSRFGIADPVFKLDLSVLMFIKPLLSTVIIYLLLVEVVSLAYGLVYSLIILNVCFDGVDRDSLAKIDLVKKIRAKVIIIAILAGLFVVNHMLLNIGNEKFTTIELKDGTSYSLYGAGQSDATVKVWGYAILAGVAVFSILRAFRSLKKQNVTGVVGNLLIVPIYLIVLAGILALYQLIFIGSNDLDKNVEYIRHNINNTKLAYGISADEINIDYSGTITEDDINENSELLSNITIVNSQNVKQNLDAQQTKGYYSYKNSKLQMYKIDDVDRSVYITPRELANVSTTYSNKTYQYTHGYGSVVTLAGETDAEGNLVTYQENIKDDSDKIIDIKEPRIYFGLENNDAVVVNSTNKKELDYIVEDSNSEVEYDYTGNAGIKLGFFDRLILGIKEGNLKLAFSKAVSKDSKILTSRNIIQRAKNILPDLKYDENPYMVIDDNGNQYWVIDAYTISNNYPFSQKTELNLSTEINYIRNSVKVIVNAFDGTIKFYITDRTDPIAMAYNNIYPEIFAGKDEAIPQDIAKHLVYSQYLYNIQSSVVEKYHNIEPEILYRANDIWEIAELSNKEPIKPYYTMVKDNDGNLVLGLVEPYTVYGKQNIISYMVGSTNNGVSQLKIYRFPSDSNVLGISQFEAQINQDEAISKEIATLNATGTTLERYTTAVPVNNTMLYVQTVFQKYINETTQKATLKKVVVGSGNKLAIGDDLSSALQRLLSQYASDINYSNSDNEKELINSIIKANENVKTSAKNGDWKMYGEDMNELTRLIDRLNVVRQENEAAKNKEKEDAEKTAEVTE